MDWLIPGQIGKTGQHVFHEQAQIHQPDDPQNRVVEKPARIARALRQSFRIDPHVMSQNTDFR
jgi:hypothetical protein